MRVKVLISIICIITLLLALLIGGCRATDTTELEEKIKELEERLDKEEEKEPDPIEEESNDIEEKEEEKVVISYDGEFNPVIIDTLDFDGMGAENVSIQENYMFLIQGNTIKILDISNNENPNEVGSLSLDNFISNFKVIGDHLYSIVWVDDNKTDLIIIDISDKSNPSVAGKYEFDVAAEKVFVLENKAYVIFNILEEKNEGEFWLVEGGFYVLDISKKDSPSIISTYNNPAGVHDIFVIDNYAYIYSMGFEILNISDIENPKNMGKYNFMGWARSLDIKNNFAYIPEGMTLNIVDISDNNNPKALGRVAINGEITTMYVQGDYVFMTYSVYDENYYVERSGFVIVDDTDKENPTVIADLEIPGEAWGISVIGDYAYLALRYLGLSIVKLYASEEEVEAQKIEEEKGEIAEDFTLLDLNNDEVTLSDYIGNVVVLNFWGTWCPPCVDEIPSIIEVNNDYKDKNVEIIGVSVGDDISILKQFVEENNINYTILVDGTIDNTENMYNVRAFPTTFFIDTEGNIENKIIGEMTTDQLINEIEKVLE